MWRRNVFTWCQITKATKLVFWTPPGLHFVYHPVYNVHGHPWRGRCLVWKSKGLISVFCCILCVLLVFLGHVLQHALGHFTVDNILHPSLTEALHWHHHSDQHHQARQVKWLVKDSTTGTNGRGNQQLRLQDDSLNHPAKAAPYINKSRSSMQWGWHFSSLLLLSKRSWTSRLTFLSMLQSLWS